MYNTRMPPLLFAAEIILGRFLNGIVPIFVKLTQANPFEIGIFRLVAATVLFFIFIHLKKKIIKFTRKNIRISILTGICFGLHWLTYFSSIKISSVTIATIGLASYGIFLMILGTIFFGEKISKKEIIALAIAIIGSIIIIPDYHFGNSITIGFLIALLSSLCFAITGALQKYSAKTTDSQTRVFSQYFFAIPIFLPFMGQTHWQLREIDWIYLAGLAIFGTLIAHTLWIKAVEKLDLKTAGIVYYLTTLFAIAGGIIVLHDTISLRTIVGGGMIIIASIMATILRKTKKVEVDLSE